MNNDKIQKHIEENGEYSYVLKRWGTEGMLKRFRNHIQRLLFTNKYDFDDYQGLFLLDRITIEGLIDKGFFDTTELIEINKLDNQFRKITVEVVENVYNIFALRKHSYDCEKYWFLYRIPKDAIVRLKLVNELHLKDKSSN